LIFVGFPFGGSVSKLGKVTLGAIGVALTLGFAHAWLNLGFDPLAKLGLRKSAEEQARFQVGFLPVT
jgi:hypothetical protein